MRLISTPAARGTDPDTSHQAAAEITASGLRHQQQEAAARAVRRHPGCTSHELAQLTGMDRYALARRLPECATAGEVAKGEAKLCTVSGRRAITWHPVVVPAQAAS